jgi:hypothetical protein
MVLDGKRSSGQTQHSHTSISWSPKSCRVPDPAMHSCSTENLALTLMRVPCTGHPKPLQAEAEEQRLAHPEAGP